jgi:hypothetical protein
MLVGHRQANSQNLMWVAGANGLAIDTLQTGKYFATEAAKGAI